MQICCTKKLLSSMNLDSQTGSEENDLFCWSAHLITVNRRKTLVVVNDSNRYGFVLHGLKAKDFKNLEALITQGIHDCLKEEKIKDEIIEKYLKDAGPLGFTRTRGPKYVSRLNKACERVDIFDDKLDSSSLFQPLANSYLNDDIIKVDKSDYDFPHELLKKDFEEFAQESVVRCEAVDLTVKLPLDIYTTWRRVIVPADITFKDFHKILQVVFNWLDYHLYEFDIFNNKGERILQVIDQEDEDYEPLHDCETLLSTEVKLKAYLKPENRIIYRYDFGDDWEHEIILNKVLDDYDKNYPRCLMGEGNAPPEDVGGVSGYKDFLEIMADPKHEEYGAMLRWAKSLGYKELDINRMNRLLKYVLRR